jgi:hypothetical protein
MYILFTTIYLLQEKVVWLASLNVSAPPPTAPPHSPSRSSISRLPPRPTPSVQRARKGAAFHAMCGVGLAFFRSHMEDKLRFACDPATVMVVEGYGSRYAHQWWLPVFD